MGKFFKTWTSILTAILSFIAIIAFWVFLYKGDVYDNWYPLVGHFIASHFAFIGIIIWQSLENQGISFREWINRFIKRK